MVIMTQQGQNPWDGRVEREPIIIDDRVFRYYARLNRAPEGIVNIYKEFVKLGIGVIPEQVPRDKYGNEETGVAFYRDERLAYQDLWHLEHASILAFPGDISVGQASELVEKALGE